MARRSNMSVLKRQRELKKAEKAAKKRAKRHGIQIEGFTEPVPTVGVSQLSGEATDEGGESPAAEPTESDDDTGRNEPS